MTSYADLLSMLARSRSLPLPSSLEPGSPQPPGPGQGSLPLPLSPGPNGTPGTGATGGGDPVLGYSSYAPGTPGYAAMARAFGGGEGPPDPNTVINAGQYAGMTEAQSPYNAPLTDVFGSTYTQSPGFNAPIQPSAQGQAGLPPQFGGTGTVQLGDGSGSGSGGSGGISPSLLSQLFPNGIPQAAIATAGAPQQVAPGDLAGMILNASQRLPQVGTSMVSGGPSTAAALGGGLPQVGTNQVGTESTSAALGGSLPNVSSSAVRAPSVLGAVGGAISPNALVDQVMASLRPTFDQQQRGLTESLANAGIVGGSTTGAEQDLAKQQTQTAASALAPFEQGAQQMLLSGATTDAGNALGAGIANQNSGLGAQEFNVGNALGVTQADLARALQAQESNQGANLSASGQNVGNALGVTQADLARAFQAQLANQQAGLTASSQNVGNAIGTGSTLAQQIMSAALANQQAGLQGSEFNASTLNSGNFANIGNELNAAQYDTGTANTLASQILGYQNQDWLAQMDLQGQMAAGAAGGQSGAFQPIFQNPAPVNFSGLASSFAKPSAPSTPPSPGYGSPYAGYPSGSGP